MEEVKYESIGTRFLRPVEWELDKFPWDITKPENDYKADTWCFGAFLYWCVVGYDGTPFYDEDFEKLSVKEIIKLFKCSFKIPKNWEVSFPLIKLIADCLK